MATRRKSHNNFEASEPKDKQYYVNLIHSIALTLFSDNEIEVISALRSLLVWSKESIYSEEDKPTPILILSIARFVNQHVKQWGTCPTTNVAVTALCVISNLIYTRGELNATNSILCASCSELMCLLQRLSFHPHSVLTRISHHILLHIAKFCDISKTIEDPKKFVSTQCSLFSLADPSTDDIHIIVFLSYALNPSNLSLFMGYISPKQFIEKITICVRYPSTFLRLFILETLYAITFSYEMVKNEVCNNNNFLRTLVSFCIPSFGKVEGKDHIPISPCQKSCVFLLDLMDDSRVLSYVAFYKEQLTKASLYWKSSLLVSIAVKLSTVNPEM